MPANNLNKIQLLLLQDLYMYLPADTLSEFSKNSLAFWKYNSWYF